jgi:uncharacterized protein YydD (DUF2326 family)
MRLSRFYSNKPNVVEPIDFAAGLNVVMAEIRIPENRKKDTHNLGKTTLGCLLDFGFLSKKDPDFFLFKHLNIFEDFVFFFEFKLADTSFVTLRRGVEAATKISFKRHKAGCQNFSELPSSSWDHHDIPFDRAKELLDGLLDWRALKSWPYRMVLGYLLRSQDDFGDVFQLAKFGPKHAHWKPFLAHVLGFDATLVNECYKKEDELTKKKETERTIKMELGGSAESLSKIEGLLQLKQKEAEKKQKLLDAFDFRSEDKDCAKRVINEIDKRIAELNFDRYALMQNKKKIQNSLEEGQILFNPDEAQRLFKEVGMFFEGQIKKDFEQLIAFNRAITEERRGYLQEELTEIEGKLKAINTELNDLGKNGLTSSHS